MTGFLKMLESPLVSMGFLFGTIQLLRFVDMTAPRTILLIRGTYIFSQMAMLLFWYYIRVKAMEKAKKSSEMVEIEEAAAPFSGLPPRKAKLTVGEYDAQEARKQMQQIVIGSIVMLVLHVWFGMVQPLVLQVIIPWKSLLTQPLVQIHLFGFEAVGSLKRPFKQPNPLAEFMSEQTAEPTAADTDSDESKQPEGRITEVKDDDEMASLSDASSKGTKPATIVSRKKKSARKED